MIDSNTLAAEMEVDATKGLKYSRTIADLPGPGGLPYLGSLLQTRGKQFHLTLEKWIREYGPVFRMTILGYPMVIVSDRQVVHDLLRERPDGFRRSGNLKSIMNELNIAGVFTAEGDEWRRQRKLFMGGMNAEVIKNFFPTLVMMAERMMKRWRIALEAGRPIDLRRDLKAMALDVIVGISMGHDVGAVNDDHSKLQHGVDNLFRCLGRRNAALFPYWRHFKTPADRTADESAAYIKKAVIGFIHDARELMSQQPHLYQKPTNMLEAMIAASENPESDFTDHDLITNAILAVIGGEDTTANTMAWMINLLARNPEAATALTAEVDAVLGDALLTNDWEMMKQFPYLEAVHNETQRVRSVAPLIGLCSNVDSVVADTFIPKNTAVIASTVALGLDEAEFPQNDQFQPERWIFEHKPQRVDDPTRKVFPFGGGARLCPGRFLALTEIKVVMSMIMRNFELELDQHAPQVTQLMNFFVAPSAVPVRLKLRR